MSEVEPLRIDYQASVEEDRDLADHLPKGAISALRKVEAETPRLHPDQIIVEHDEDPYAY